MNIDNDNLLKCIRETKNTINNNNNLILNITNLEQKSAIKFLHRMDKWEEKNLRINNSKYQL